MSVTDVLAGNHRWWCDQGDCIAWLDSIPADSVDPVFGSPPYEQARLYLENGQDTGIARDSEEWVAWMVKVCHAARRVCRGLRAFVVEGQTRDYRCSCSPDLLCADLCRAGFCLRKSPINHRVGIPGGGGNRKQHEENGGGADWLRNDYEPIVCFTRGGKLPWADATACGQAPKWKPGGAMSNRLTDGRRVKKRSAPSGYANGDQAGRRHYAVPDLANPGNVITCNIGGGRMGSALAHDNEAPFPEKLARLFLRSFCPPGGVVADCFAGSGTTLAVAVAEGRRALGCDVRASQVELTRRRLLGETPTMFPA
jgi:hypothetical protein